MENKKVTSLKVWKQTQEKIKLIAAMKRKTMFEVLDEMADKELLQEKRADEVERTNAL